MGNPAHPYHDLPATLDHDDIRKIVYDIRQKIKNHNPGLLTLVHSLPEKGRLSFDYPSELIQIER